MMKVSSERRGSYEVYDLSQAIEKCATSSLSAALIIVYIGETSLRI